MTTEETLRSALEAAERERDEARAHFAGSEASGEKLVRKYETLLHERDALRAQLAEAVRLLKVNVGRHSVTCGCTSCAFIDRHAKSLASAPLHATGEGREAEKVRVARANALADAAEAIEKLQMEAGPPWELRAPASTPAAPGVREVTGDAPEVQPGSEGTKR